MLCLLLLVSNCDFLVICFWVASRLSHCCFVYILAIQEQFLGMTLRLNTALPWRCYSMRCKSFKGRQLCGMDIVVVQLFDIQMLIWLWNMLHEKYSGVFQHIEIYSGYFWCSNWLVQFLSFVVVLVLLTYLCGLSFRIQLSRKKKKGPNYAF